MLREHAQANGLGGGGSGASLARSIAAKSNVSVAPRSSITNENEYAVYAANVHDAVLTAKTGSGWQMSSVNAGADSFSPVTGLAAIGVLPISNATTISLAIN
jgi:hypothetical protein